MRNQDLIYFRKIAPQKFVCSSDPVHFVPNGRKRFKYGIQLRNSLRYKQLYAVIQRKNCNDRFSISIYFLCFSLRVFVFIPAAAAFVFGFEYG